MKIENFLNINDINSIYHGTDNIALIKQEGKIKVGLSDPYQETPAYKNLIYFTTNEKHNKWYHDQISSYSYSFKLNINNQINFLEKNLTIDEDMVFNFCGIDEILFFPYDKPHPLSDPTDPIYVYFPVKQRTIPSVNYLKSNKSNIIKDSHTRYLNKFCNITKPEKLFNYTINLFEELKINENIIIYHLARNTVEYKNNYLDLLEILHNRNNPRVEEIKQEMLDCFYSPSIALYGNIILEDWDYEIISN